MGRGRSRRGGVTSPWRGIDWLYNRKGGDDGLYGHRTDLVHQDKKSHSS